MTVAPPAASRSEERSAGRGARPRDPLRRCRDLGPDHGRDRPLAALPALEFFGEVSPWEFLTGTTWTPLFLDGQFGVLPLVVGTLSISFWSALVAFPLGIGVAIYLSEYANQRAPSF